MSKILKGLFLRSITMVVGLMIGSVLLNAAPVQAADGSGTNTVTPTSTNISTTGNTFTFTFTAAETMDSGGISIASPTGWSAAQGTNGSAGYTTVSTTGMIATVIDTADSATGWNTGSACNNGAPTADTSVFHEGTASIRCTNGNESNNDQWYKGVTSQDWSTYTSVGFWIRTNVTLTSGQLEFAYDNTAALASALEVLTLPAVSADTWTYVTLNFGATTRTAIVSYGFRATSNSSIDDKTIYIDDILMGPGAPTFSSGVVSARILTLANTETITTTYGSGGGASGVTAPATAGTYTATTTARISDSGTLTNIASHPTLTAKYPVPTLTSISPSSGTLNGSGFTMNATGTNFVTGQTVLQFNGSSRVTTVDSSTTLHATILASDLNTVGTFDVTAFNPTPGGGTSGAQTFTVNKIGTTIAVSSSASTATYGDTVTFTATTTPASGGPATGTVTFKNGGVTMGTGSLSGNVATFATSSFNFAGSPYSITAVYGGDSSFLGSTSSAITQTITKKALTVTGLTASNKTYDATTTVTLSGGTLVGTVGSDIVSINTRTGSFADKNVGTGKTVTVTSVTLTGADAGNYTVTNPTGITANITAATLTVTGMTASNKTYDATTTATLSGGSLVGVFAGDTASIDTRVGSFADKNVGTGKTVTVTSVTLTGTDAGNYTVTNPTGITANITAAALTVTGMTASTKTYDATTTATLSGGSLVGVFGGDTTSINTRTGTFNNKNVGVGKPITVTSVTLTGTDAGNYTVTNPTDVTGMVTAKTLAISATADAKTYDGTTAATVSLSDDRIGGDSLTSTSTSATFADKNVGTGKTVTVSGISISGTDSGNYTPNTSTTTTANISARTLAISATGINKTYDGTTAASVTLSDNRVGGDTLSIASTSVTFADRNFGTAKLVTVSGLAISGTDSGNYSANTSATTTANISKLSITVTAATNTKEYDRTTTASSTPIVTVGSIQTGDSASFTETYDTKNVGTGKTLTPAGSITDGNGGLNYTVTFANNTTGIITAKALTVTATGISKIYDASTTASVTLSATPISGDSVTPTSTSATFDIKNVGTGKTVTVSGITIGGTDGANYSAANSTTTATANITARAITVTAQTNTKEYDQTTNASSTPTITSGVLQGSDTSSFTETYDTKNVGTGKTLAPTGSVTDGNSGLNYAVTFVNNTTGVITAKALTVTGTVGVDKVYDQTTTASVTGGTLDGVIAGDTVSLNNASTSASFANKNVGTGKTITVTGVALSGTDAGNYTVANPTGITANITAKALVVTATASAKTYDANTTASISLSDDRISGDVFTATSTSATFADKNVGTAKTVTVSGISISGTDSTNYSANSTTTAIANITARAITVTAQTNTKEYDQTTNASSTPTITVGAIQAGDSAGFTESYDTKNVGTGKTLTPSGTVTDGNSGNNYAVTFANNTTGVITAKGLTVTGMTGVNKVYDSFTTASVTGGTLDGVISGDTVSLNNASTSASFADKNVGTGKTITVSGVAISGTDVGNYSVTNPTGITANITAAGLTVTGLIATDRVYNATTTVTVSGGSLVGILGSDTVSINTRVGAFADKHVGTNKLVTITAVTLSGGDAGNYTVTLPSGVTATITQLGLTISGVTANDKDYDGNTTATLNTGGATLNTIFGGDDAPLDSASAVGTFDTAEVGDNKLVTVSGLAVGGADGGNYLLAQPTTTASIRNPVPRVNSVSPNEAFVNDPDTNITVSGLAFTPGTVIRFDGNNLTTTFINGTTATATIPTAYLGAVGTSTITAFNPTPGGGISTTSASFLIKNHVPVITLLSPDNTEEGSATTSLAISGNSFAANATVTFDGTPLSIDSQSTTTINTNIPASLLATFGTSTVAVTNPTPGGGTATSSFIITRGAVLFTFSGEPYSGTVDAPITVTIQAKKENGTIATSYQSDVTLIKTGSATGGGLVNIINGVGTTTISNTVAETVTLSLSDTQGTGLDVTATTSATFAHGAITQFTLAGPATLNVGDRAAFTVTRKDQFSNPVTTGPDTTAYFYTTSTSTSKAFYDASTAGNIVTSAIIASGASTTMVWYYDEDPGVYTITVSDNGTAPDGAAGIDDATSTLTVNAVATRFVIIDPTDGTVDAPIMVVVQAQDNLGRIITDYQSDVTLIASSTGGSVNATSTLVNIVNGSGTTTISDTIAETVFLSLLDSQSTGLNVASSTQDVVFAPGVVTQFSLTHSGDMEQNSRKEFTVGRKDQFSNGVSASTTIGYLYASPTSTVKFYDAASGGSEITFITLTPGNATTSFWFYSNAPATTTVTVSDNATTSDGTTGIDDASNEIRVTPIAVRFELLDPADGTVDAAITVTVRALDEFGQVVSSFNEDVTLVVTGSAVANPALIDIVGGIGTTQLTDTVAQTVDLSLSDSQSTGLAATSTQDVVFAVGAFAKLNLNNVTSATAGTLVPYTVTRTDQYNNQITGGSMLISLSATPTTTPGVFYGSNSTSTSAITSISIDSGNASGQFWYYNEAAGSYQVTTQNGSVTGYDDVVIDPATIAKFTINDRTSMNPASRVQYTVTRKDQFNNLVTTGDVTAYLYADPTGTSTAFYNAATDGTIVTSVTIGSGQSAQSAWYYEETAGTHVITASDNATTPDGTSGLIDATDSITVQVATGTRFVFYPLPAPQTVSAGSASVVTIQAQDNFGNIDSNYQSDVTLVTGVNSAFGTGFVSGQALIDIVNGEGTITISDNIAEVVNLALSDSQGTGLNVSAVSSITWIPGAVTQFILTDQTSMVAGSSTPYVVTRKDQYDNAVTSGSNIVYLYSNSTGAQKRFQASETGTTSISFVTLSGSMASTTFWYYDEAAGTWDITASDNATASDGATGIADASDSLIVTPAPVVADRYTILDPADTGLNENTVIIIQAQDANGALGTTIQEDVYLVFSTSSIQTTGLVDRRVLVNIVDGVGTVTVTDGVAETVQLSLERLTGSTSTLAITSTQDVMFFVRQQTSGGGGGGIYIAPTVSFSGRAYPGARVSLFARIGGQDITLERDIEVKADGTFTIEFTGALKGLESFGLAILDKDGKVAQIKTYNMNKVTKVTEGKNLYIAPTTGLVQRTVTIGNNVGITGSAAPGSVIRAEVDGKPVDTQAQVGSDGTYRLLINTRELAYGGHIVRTKQIDKNGIESDYSTLKVFTVSRTLVTRADLNNNGGIDIGDWSIFLTRFGSTNAETRRQVDLNNDGKVDISDFSIFIRSTVGR